MRKSSKANRSTANTDRQQPREHCGQTRVNLVALLLLVLSFAGCTHVCTRRVEIVDLETFGTMTFQGKSKCWDEVVPPAFQSEQVSQLGPSASNLVLVTRRVDGSILDEKILPFYDRFFAATPFALRPDANAAAYFPSDSTAIHLFDFASQRQTRITGNLARDHAHIEAMVWADNRYLLAVFADELDEVHNAQGQSRIVTTVKGSLVKVDSEAKVVVAQVFLEGPGECALSPSSKLVAVTQSSKAGAPIRIFDTCSLSVVAESPGAEGRWMSCPAWCPDESMLAYCEGIQGTPNKWLSVFSLSTGLSRKILRLPDDHVCYFVGFPRADLLVFRSNNPRNTASTTQMCFINLRSGEVEKVLRGDFNGLSAVLANGHAIVSEKGY